MTEEPKCNCGKPGKYLSKYLNPICDECYKKDQEEYIPPNMESKPTNKSSLESIRSKMGDE